MKLAGEERRRNQFMIGLAKLTRETGIAVAGCGCCGSPRLDDLSANELSDARAGYGYGQMEEVAWIGPHDACAWERHGASVVRAEVGGNDG